MSNTNIRNILEDHWKEIKSTIKNKWSKLTDDDLEKIDGSYDELTGTIQKLYGYKGRELENTVNEFFESDYFTKFKDQAETKFSEIKSSIFSILDEYFKIAKKRTRETEKAMSGYAKDNPYKLIGIAAAFGLLVGCLYKNNK